MLKDAPHIMHLQDGSSASRSSRQIPHYATYVDTNKTLYFHIPFSFLCSQSSADFKFGSVPNDQHSRFISSNFEDINHHKICANLSN